MKEASVQLKQIATMQVVGEWDHIEDLLMCARGAWEEHYTLDQIKELLLGGALQFWHLRNVEETEPYLGAMTRIDVYGKKRVFQIFWLGGDHFGQMIDFLWVLELWAVKLDCADLEVIGRDGFERMLKPYGFQRTHVVLRKELKHVSGREH